ncbi:hypothetical protein OV208_25630 [Corallococcus sp. bb12-1]|uniref:hypothetical protein n=1 Tax=Corallococcus sp. bb12-1 TaxID=2996784 RepID=UPI00226D5087|nr:hypothetical protein [Corallococcus sp. bb12-1]MCY1044723.1 hypothetical protein [Corallococcus sp. bb12-1]
MPPRPTPPPQLQTAPEKLQEFVRNLLTLDVEEPWDERSQVKQTGSATWTPSNPYTLVMGPLEVDGNVLVSTGKHDDGVLIVFGDVTCRNLYVGVGFSFVCTGTLRVREALVTRAADSIAYVAGAVEAELLDSGSGAWLTLFGDPSLLRVKHLTHYVMHGRTPIKPPKQPDLRTLVVPEVLDTEEWDSLSAEEQAEESPEALIQLDTRAVHKRLMSGASLFLAP